MIRTIARWLGIITKKDVRRAELRRKLAMCGSPMEQRFLLQAERRLSRYTRIIPQFAILNYRVDFALPDVRIVIEIDGHDYHSSKEQLAADMSRQRKITAEGWTVLRFTGSEIFRNAAHHVAEVGDIINRNSGRGK